MGQGVYLTPSFSNPTPGSAVTYWVGWEGSTPGLAHYSWTITFNGAVINASSSSSTAATVVWPSTGTGIVRFSATTNSSGIGGYPSFATYSAELTVSVAIPAPSTPVVCPPHWYPVLALPPIGRPRLELPVIGLTFLAIILTRF